MSELGRRTRDATSWVGAPPGLPSRPTHCKEDAHVVAHHRHCPVGHRDHGRSDRAPDPGHGGRVTSSHARRAVALLERAIVAREATTSLRALTALRHELDALEHQQVARALAEGRSFSAIARPLGITRQAAHRRYRHLIAGPTVSAD